MSRIINAPRMPTMTSRAAPARFHRNTTIAMSAEIAPPTFGSTAPSVSACTPRPVPAMLPMLNTSPPIPTRTASTQPRPGSTELASSLARRPDTPRMRHTLSWMTMSTRIDSKIANANAAPIWTVNTDVWVRKPGPMADVAMRKMAPTMGPMPRAAAGGFAVASAAVAPPRVGSGAVTGTPLSKTGNVTWEILRHHCVPADNSPHPDYP